MPSVNDIYKQQSDKIKAEDLGNNMYTVTISGVEFVEFNDTDRKLVISFQDAKKTLVLNKTNANAIAQLYGEDYSMWPGSKITIFAMPVDYQGKQVMGVRIRAPGGAQAPMTSQGQLPTMATPDVTPQPQSVPETGGANPFLQGQGNGAPQAANGQGVANPAPAPATAPQASPFPGDQPSNADLNDAIPFP